MKNILFLITLVFFSISCQFSKGNDTISLTTMEVEDRHRKYSPILKGSLLKISYKITNTGENPLVISEIQTSCNCTVSEITKSVIGTGDYGFINLVFNSDKNNGLVKQYITILANVENTLQNTISFETNVISNTHHSHHSHDNEEIYFEENQVERFSKNYIPILEN